MLHPWHCRQINYFFVQQSVSCTSRSISLSADRHSGRLSKAWAKRALVEWGHFLDALNSKHPEEESHGHGFSLSGYQRSEGEWFCCCTEPPLSMVHIQGVWEEVWEESLVMNMWRSVETFTDLLMITLAATGSSPWSDLAPRLTAQRMMDTCTM